MSALSYQLARRAHELLADGQWHDREEIILELAKLVPPGLALRKADAWREVSERQRRRRGQVPAPYKTGRPLLPVGARIRSGARRIAREHLQAATVYEVRIHKDYAGTRRQRGDSDVRLVGEHKWVRGDPYYGERQRLEYELELARQRLELLCALVIEAGRGDLASAVLGEQDCG